MKRLCVLLILSTILVGCLQLNALNYYNKTFTEKTIEVIDAQTYVVINNKKQQNQIFLYGIIVPKVYSDTGKAAKKYISDQILNKRIRFTVKGVDSKNRLISFAYLEGKKKTLNEMLLEKGYAKVYTDKCRLPECSSWKDIEKRARSGKKGMFK